MDIFASNFNHPIGSFLHAGYVSSSERPISSIYDFGHEDLYPEMTPKIELEVTSALRLKEAKTEETASITAGAGKPSSFTSNTGVTTSMIAGVSFFILIVGVLYVLRKHLQSIHKRLIPAVSVTALAIIVIFVGCISARNARSYDLPPEDATAFWEGVPIQEYADPEQATLAIVYALVAEGLRSISDSVSTLVQIKNEVGLPKKNLTQGERYAIQTYGLDGWGTPFELHGNSEEGYTLMSAGPDKIFSTEDDQKFFFYSHRYIDFGYMERAFFIQKINGELAVCLHRFNWSYFKYYNQEMAIEIMGSDLFDLVFVGEINKDEFKTACMDTYNRYKDTFSYEPLILQVRGRSPRL